MKKVLIVLLLFIVIVCVASIKSNAITLPHDDAGWKFTETVDKDIRYRIPRPEFKKLIE